MNSEVVDGEVFKEYKELGPKRRSLEHYIVFFLHLAVAIILFVNQLIQGLGPEFYGNGIVTPILLILNGAFYAFLENDSWYREQMVPFISRIISTTEIETDRYCQFHRRIARLILIIGWAVILIVQWVVYFGFLVLPLFDTANLLIAIAAELFAYGLIFGPYFLYFLILMAITGVMDKLFPSVYNDILHLLEVERKWTKENDRRAKGAKLSKDRDDPYDRQGF